MIERVITIATLDYDSATDDLVFWLSQQPEQRLEAVDVLRHRVFDLSTRMEKVLEVAELDDDRKYRPISYKPVSLFDMRIETDFEDFVRLFNNHKVEYLMVGAYALAYHGVPRATQDFDLYVRPTPKNADKIAQALEEFGFEGLHQQDLLEPGKVIMMGRSPMRIDLLTSISGVRWATAWKNKVRGRYGAQPIFVLGKNELIVNKRATARTKDLADLEALGAIQAKKPGPLKPKAARKTSSKKSARRSDKK
jgi:hypothetical protein